MTTIQVMVAQAHELLREAGVSPHSVRLTLTFKDQESLQRTARYVGASGETTSLRFQILSVPVRFCTIDESASVKQP